MAAFTLLTFALTLFCSATLLFLVQPMVGKVVLPFLGGTPAVWNTCMVFFQALLLAGYSYGHFLTRHLSVKKQIAVHAFVLALPIVPLAWLHFDVGRVAGSWPPPAGANPAWWLLAVLFLVAGLPFFAVSTTAPLLQKWFAATSHPSARDPYFLYGASNLGSMLALLAYPALVERKVGVQAQELLWAGAFVVLAALILLCGIVAARTAVPAKSDVDATEAPGRLRQLRWVLLAFVPSSLMLGVTTYLTTDIAAIPLLWIVPLALYLLSFIFVFSGTFVQNLCHWLVLSAIACFAGYETWARLHGLSPDAPALALKIRMVLCASAPLVGLLLFFNHSRAFLHGLWLLLLPVLIVTLIINSDLPSEEKLKQYELILLHLATLFAAAMVCHGELARTRPGPAHLTGFFLLVSFGGVLGGLCNGLVAPLTFDNIVEYPLVVALACLLLPRFGVTTPGWLSRLDFALAGVLGLFGLVSGGFFLANAFLTPTQVAVFLERYLPRDEFRPEWAKTTVRWLVAHVGNDDVNLLRRERNFFGFFRVFRYVADDGTEYHYMQHGTTTHGMQCYYPEDRRGEPLTYFHRLGPIGQLFEAVDAKKAAQHVCVLGVGTGTLAAYMKPGWDLTLYDIDRAVVDMAMDTRYFTYLPDAIRRGVNVKVNLGDGRLQIARAGDHAFDLIFMDAFTSDAVPVHLLTREALQIYLQKLAPGGMIVVNIANRYLQFESVLGNLADDLKIRGWSCKGEYDLDVQMYASNWVVLARDDASIGPLLDFNASKLTWHPLPTDPALGVWTDDYTNLLAVFEWGN